MIELMVDEVGNQYIMDGQTADLHTHASSIRALQPSTVLALGGEPVGARFPYRSLVSSSQDRSRQAAEEWDAGRVTLRNADDRNFIPLPDSLPLS